MPLPLHPPRGAGWAGGAAADCEAESSTATVSAARTGVWLAGITAEAVSNADGESCIPWLNAPPETVCRDSCGASEASTEDRYARAASEIEGAPDSAERSALSAEDESEIDGASGAPVPDRYARAESETAAVSVDIPI